MTAAALIALAFTLPGVTNVHGPGPRGVDAPLPGAGPLDMEALICSYPWPCGEALTVAYCEDRDLDPAVVNWAGPYVGPFQVGPGHGATVEQLQDPGENVRVAFALWQEPGAADRPGLPAGLY